MDFLTYTTIELQLAPFHDNGMTREETKEIIEGIFDHYSSAKFVCREPIKGNNWCVTTNGTTRQTMLLLVGTIESALITRLIDTGRAIPHIPSRMYSMAA